MSKKNARVHLLHALLWQIILSVFLSLSSLFIFFKLTEDVFEKNVFAVDTLLTNIIYALRSPFATQVMSFITFLGSPLFLLVLSSLVVLFLLTKRRKDALIYSGILYSGIVLNLILKLIIHRPRPDYLPIVNESSFSFPSGHAMNSFVFFAALCYFIFRETKNLKLTIIVSLVSIFIVIAIGISRIYLGVHFPSDIIAGWIAGFIWFISAILFEKVIIFERLYKRSK